MWMGHNGRRWTQWLRPDRLAPLLGAALIGIFSQSAGAVENPTPAAPPAAAAHELLVNDFEQGLGRWLANDGARATGQAPAALLTTFTLATASAADPGAVHGGRHSLQIDFRPGQGWANVFYSRYGVGDTWAAASVDELALWLRGDGQDKAVGVTLHCWSDDLKPVSFSMPVSLKEAAWHEVVIPLERFQAANPATPLRVRGLINVQFDGSGEIGPARLWVDDIRVRNARGAGALFAALPDQAALAQFPPVQGLPRVGTFGFPQEQKGTPEQAKALGLGFSSNGMMLLSQSRMALLDGMATDYTPDRTALLEPAANLPPADCDQDAQGRTMGEGIKGSVFQKELTREYCALMAGQIRDHAGAPWVCSVSLVSPVSMYGEHHMAASTAGQYAVYSRPAKANFQGWLKERYGGDLAALNTAWGAAFQNWDEIVPPEGPSTSPQGVDTRRSWSDFMHWYNGWSDEVLRQMLTAAREATAKPILIWLGGPKVGASQGISLGNIGPYAKLLAQVNPAIMNDTDAQTLFSLKYTAAACHQYGIGMMMENVGPPYLELCHQYNMVFNLLASGAQHVRLAHLGELYDPQHWFGQFWAAHAPLLTRYQLPYRASEAAFFHSYVTSWYRPDRSNMDTVRLYDATNTLWTPDQRYPSWGRALGSPDVLDDTMIEDGALAGRKLLVIPNSSVTVTTRPALDAIRRWVEQGGTLVGFGAGCLAWTVEPDRALRAMPGLGEMLSAAALTDAAAAATSPTLERAEAPLGRGRVILYRTPADPAGAPEFTRAMLPVLAAEAARAGVARPCWVEGNEDEAVNLIDCGRDQASGRHLFALDLMSRGRPQPEFLHGRRLTLHFDPALTGEAELVGLSGVPVSGQGGAITWDGATCLMGARWTLPGSLTLELAAQ